MLFAVLVAALLVSVPTPSLAAPSTGTNNFETLDDEKQGEETNTLATTLPTSKPVESRLDNPNYFEGDLDISQATIDAYYETKDGVDVSKLYFYKLHCC